METFALPMSSEYYHENRHRARSRATNLIRLLGRPASSSPSLSQNTASFLVDLNREDSMSHKPKASVSSRPGSRKEASHENPIATAIAAPKGPAIRITSKEGQPRLLRRMASLTHGSPKREKFEVELKPLKSIEDIRNSDQPQNCTHTCSVSCCQKAGSPASKIASQSQSRKLTNNILVEEAPKFRVVGRGGSGSKLRQASISVSAVGPDVPPPRPPPPAVFYRPTGRGGIGSSAKPLGLSKPPISVLSLLSGRIQKVQRHGQCKCKSQEVSSHTRAQSLSSDPNPRPQNKDLVIISSYSQVSLDDGSFAQSTTAASSTSEGLRSLSQNSDPLDYGSTISLEESIGPVPNEHHQRSVNKVSKTLGVLAAPLMEGIQSVQVSKSSLSTFNKPLRKYSETLISNLSDKFSRSGSSRPSSMFVDDLHRFNYAGEFSKPWGDLDDSSSVDENIPHSPITFAPGTPPKTTPHPLPPSNIDTSETTTTLLPAGESDSNTSTELEPPTPPPKDRDPRIRRHSTSFCAPPPQDDPPQAPNGLPVKANWLVPPGAHNDNMTAITRDVKHPQSWRGEWNNDMQNVIDSLRRL